MALMNPYQDIEYRPLHRKVHDYRIETQYSSLYLKCLYAHGAIVALHFTLGTETCEEEQNLKEENPLAAVEEEMKPANHILEFRSSVLNLKKYF